MKLNFSTLICVALLSTLSLIGQTSHLSNLSVLNQSGTGSNALTAGFTVGSGPAKQVLIRAIGPSLSTYGVNGVMADPSITIFDSAGNAIATNDNWDPSLANIFNQVGAFPLPSGSKDAAVIATLTQGNYTARVTGMGSSPTGNVIIELYEVSANSTQLVNLSALTQVGGTGSSTVTAGLSVAQGIGSRLLLIRAVGPTLTTYGVPNVISNPQLQLYSGSNVIAQNDDWGTPVGLFAASSANLASAFAQSGAFALPTGSKDAAILVNLPSGNYTIQVTGVNSVTGTALIEAYDLTNNSQQTLASPNSPLYYAQLRPTSTATSSTGGCYVSITFDSTGNALVTVNISNLSSAQTNAYLRLTGSNAYLLGLPTGQVSQQTWKIGPIGIYSANDIINALNSGQIYLSIATANYPDGELVGTLAPTKGSQTFTAPAAAPTLSASSLNSPSKIDAARLLTQATFGATDTTIAQAQSLGINGWIQNQMSLPQTSFWSLMRKNATNFPTPLYNPSGDLNPRVFFFSDFISDWSQLVLTAPDQLRQRVAFALSEIFVISGSNEVQCEPYANYYDILAKDAFGNFRTLINDITLNGEMGVYLTYIQNQKANAVTGTSPDENYARELQQLFTVGLVQLNPDGTLMLDSTGNPIPTYNNTTITQTAKILTGWAWTNKNNNFFTDPTFSDPGPEQKWQLYGVTNGRFSPMTMYEAYHDQTAKSIISLQQLPLNQASPTTIPAGTTGTAELKILLDTLFNHPNTGPFICKQLIQKLVTSNPSPAYVYRVAQVFANNGKGTRGDLGAVITAILTDYEARSPDVINNAGYGKIKEPLLRFTALLRALNTSAPNGLYVDGYYNMPTYSSISFEPTNNPTGNLGMQINSLNESIFQSPSVFNFFSPFYSPMGAVSQAGLVAPEMQISDSTTELTVPNLLTSFIYKTPPYDPTAPSPSPYLINDFSSLIPLSTNPSSLISELNILFCGGNMSSATQDVITQSINSIPIPSPITNYPTAKQIALNASSSGLVAPKVAALDPVSNLTLEAWLFPTVESATGYTFIAGKRGDYVGDPYEIYDLLLIPGGFASFSISSGAAGTSRGINTSKPLPLGVWTHIAATYDGSTIKMYVNGILDTQTSAKTTIPSLPNAPFSIAEGYTSSGSSNFSGFTGYISQVSLWNVAKSATQIQQHMTQGIPTDKSGLIGGWLLDDNSSTQATDYSGNNLNLTAGANSSLNWVATNGTSLDRVQTAINLTIASPDAALQK